MKNKIILLFTIVAITLASCKKSFFDINENPNLATKEAIEPRLLLPMVLNATAKKMAIDYGFAAQWMGYWARGGNFGPSVPLENYNITTTYQQNNWTNGNTASVNPIISWFDIIKDADDMEKKAKELNQPFYQGAAKVVKSIGFMYLVDMYNNVPYSEALDILKHIAPKYDKGSDIYADLLLQLDTANTLFNENMEITPAVRSSDVMFSGDVDMWHKLVNTQKLKLLIHQSEVLGSAPTAEINKILAEGSGFLMAGETAEVQPGYSINAYQLNPFYAAFLRDQNGTLVDDFNRASKYLLNKFRDNDDIRYQYVFSKAANPLNGDYYGSVLGGPVLKDTLSSVMSNVAGPGLAKSATQSQWLFTSVESMFLQAEATQRGWLTGNAELAYRAAVNESFDWLGVTDAATVADAYLDNQSVASWAGATDKVQLIVSQKYLALVGINNFEAWVDYRRLGVPADVPISLNTGRAGRVIPLRLAYPQNEYSYNANNVKAEGTIDPQTSRIFWDPN